LKLGGGVDLSIFNGPQAQFWKVEKDQKIVAVNSGFWTDDRQYRSRGLYVLKEHRGLGLAKKLLEHAVEFAASEKAELIWSMPRVSVLKVYQSVGFHQIGSEFIDGVEFGPNVFAIRNL
jgi:GNAT superfamily N-acetyltransferase